MAINHTVVLQHLEAELSRARAKYQDAQTSESQLCAGRIVVALTQLVVDARDQARIQKEEE